MRQRHYCDRSAARAPSPGTLTATLAALLLALASPARAGNIFDDDWTPPKPAASSATTPREGPAGSPPGPAHTPPTATPRPAVTPVVAPAVIGPTAPGAARLASPARVEQAKSAPTAEGGLRQGIGGPLGPGPQGAGPQAAGRSDERDAEPRRPVRPAGRRHRRGQGGGGLADLLRGRRHDGAAVRGRRPGRQGGLVAGRATRVDRVRPRGRLGAERASRTRPGRTTAGRRGLPDRRPRGGGTPEGRQRPQGPAPGSRRRRPTWKRCGRRGKSSGRPWRSSSHRPTTRPPTSPSAGISASSRGTGTAAWRR